MNKHLKLNFDALDAVKYASKFNKHAQQRSKKIPFRKMSQALKNKM